jgi:subtilisin family serine protease
MAIGIVRRRLSLLMATVACVGSACGSSETEKAVPPVASSTVPQVEAVTSQHGVSLLQPKPTGSNLAQPRAIPSQLVVKFKSTGSKALTDCVKANLRRGRSFSVATADRSASLDPLMKRVTAARSLVPGREGLTTSAARTRLHRQIAANTKRVYVGSRAVDDLVNVYLLELTQSADLEATARAFEADPHVEYAQPNYRVEVNYTPNDPFLASSGSWGQAEADLWGLQALGAQTAWDSARGAGVVVAVVDTGVDGSHPDLAPNVWQNAGEIAGNGVDDDQNGFIDDVVGWDMAADDNDPTDEHGHGTHVSGTIAAQDNNAQGIVGVAPDARIMAIKGLDEFGAGNTFDLAQGIVYAASNGARVINNSWGCLGSCPSNPVAEEAVRLAHDAGSVVVFAAGNSITDIAKVSPQNQPQVIVVSASTPTDQLASFSNFGLLDVAAPGAGTQAAGVVEPLRGILSLKSAVCDPGMCPPELIVSGQYLRQAGTSMAAPHAAGLAALVLSQHPEYSNEQVRQAMRRSGVDSNANGYDSNLGYGRIDAAGAVAQPEPLAALLEAPLQSGESELTIAGSAAGAAFASYTLEYAAGAFPASWTLLTSSSSPVVDDTIAVWDLSTVSDGEYTLRLTATTTDGRSYEDRHQLVLDHLDISSPASVSSHRGGAIISIEGTASPGNFESYDIFVERLADGSRVEDAEITLTGGGQAPVVAGELGTWDTSGIATGHYRIVLEVTHQDQTTAKTSVGIVVDPRLHEGWPQVLANNTYPGLSFQEHVTLADVNADGMPEQLIAWDDRVSVFTHDGSQLPGWPQTLDPEGIGALTQRAPAVGDVDGDGVVDVVASSGNGDVFVWNVDGSLKPGFPQVLPSDQPALMTLALADVELGGGLEIVVSHFWNGIHIVRGDGSPLPGWPAAVGGIGVSEPPVVADLDLDGDVEVVASNRYQQGQLFVLDHLGNVLPGWPLALAPGSQSNAGYPVVGDLDADGDLEIVVSATTGFLGSGMVAAFHHDATSVAGWPVVPGVDRIGAPVLGDLDADGSLDIVVGTGREDLMQQLYVWDNAGNLRSGWPHTSPANTNAPFLTPIIVDVDDDGQAEVIASRSTENFSFELLTGFGFPLQVLRANGTPIPELARPAFGGGGLEDVSPGVADMDGDGALELVWTEATFDFLTGRTRVRSHVWDLTTPADTYQPWPMYRRDALHSAIAASVLEVVELGPSDTGKNHSIDGAMDFALHTGGQGVLQFIHPWGAAVKYAINGGPLLNTPAAWGGSVVVPANTDITLRVVTPGPMVVNIQWW